MPQAATAQAIPTPFVPGHICSTKSPVYTQSASNIAAALEKYVSECKAKDRSPTVPGMAFTLGFNSRQALWEFLHNSKHLQNGRARKRQTILDAIKRVKLYIEDVRVSNMVDGKGSVPGAIFDLKNNHGYRDQVDVVQDTHMTIRWASDIAPIDAQVVDNKEQIPETTGSS